MGLVVGIDIVCCCLLVMTAVNKGFEGTLPVTAFLIVLFPVESQIRTGFFDLTTQRVIIIVLVALYTVYGKPQKRPLPLKSLVLVLMAWMLLSSATSVVPEVSIKATLSQFFDFFVPYYIFARTVSKIETIQKCLFGFVAGMFVCSIFGFLEAYQDWSILSIFPTAHHRFGGMLGAVSDRGIRVESTFGHPILFGAALAMTIPLALYLVSLATTKVRKIFLWSAMMLMFLCIYKTGSRGPWLALALGLLILLTFNKDKVRKYVLMIALLTAVVLVARPGVWQTIVDLYANTMNPDSAQGESYQWRYALYNVAKQQLGKDLGRALWGYGPESFFYLGLTTEFRSDGELKTVEVESCDSAVVELMMDTGYVGLLLVAALLFSAGLVSFRDRFSLPAPANSLCLVFFASIFAFCFLMTSVELFGWGQQSYMLWILIALAMVYHQMTSKERVQKASGVSGMIEVTPPPPEFALP